MRRVALALSLAAALATRVADASQPTLFGHGAEDAALARADAAGCDPAAAAVVDPALAAAGGFRLRLGWSYATLDLSVDGRDADVRPASGTDIDAQLGGKLGEVDLGVAMATHVPDTALARVAFRPATEPQFPLYEGTLQRMTFDVAVAARFRKVALGVGTTGSLDVGGTTAFDLGQDANGTFADAALDVKLPYRLAPIGAVQVDLGRFALALTARGPLAVDLHLESIDTVALADSPVNGTTRVLVTGSSGYDPALVDLAARADLPFGLRAFAALEYAAWSAAPPPVADVDVDVHLGTTPSQRRARFVEPRFRDTIGPRLGIEIDRTRWAARAGWSFSPSPVPRQTGYTSYADGARHLFGLGAELGLGRAAGVDLALGGAATLGVLASRTETKPNPALPHARYTASGWMLGGVATLGARWR